MWNYNSNYYRVLTFGCLNNESVSSRNGSQWYIQSKQGCSANLDMIKIQVLIFLNNKYADLFPSFKHVKRASFLNHSQGKKQFCGIVKGGFSWVGIGFADLYKDENNSNQITMILSWGWSLLICIRVRDKSGFLRTTPLHKCESKVSRR